MSTLSDFRFWFRFYLKIFHSAGCGRLSMLCDELAALGLDSGLAGYLIL
jgi:hypothetical protein